MENQGTVKVKFPRETDTKSGWTIDFSFLSRVRHSIPPDEDEWVPSHEEVQAVLLAIEVIPTGIFTQPKVEQEPVAWTAMAFARLGVVRDKMHPDDVLTVQRFLDGNYTPSPQRQPLSDGQIEKCYETTGHYQTLRPQDRFAVFALARAIEAAHRIKEKNT